MPISYNTLGPAEYDARLKAFIQQLEGEELMPYLDTTGNPTIGWGFAINRDQSGNLRNPQARRYLLSTVLGIDPNRPGLSAQGQFAEKRTDKIHDPGGIGESIRPRSLKAPSARRNRALEPLWMRAQSVLC